MQDIAVWKHFLVAQVTAMGLGHVLYSLVIPSEHLSNALQRFTGIVTLNNFAISAHQVDPQDFTNIRHVQTVVK